MAKMTNYGSNVEGLRRALRKLPKEAGDELKEASHDIADLIATGARREASFLQGRHKAGGWKYLGPTLRAYRSRIPEVKLGGKRRIPGRRGTSQTVGDLLFGLEFGGGKRPSTRQFLPHKGTTGYALWPTVRAKEDETFGMYSKALLHALEQI